MEDKVGEKNILNQRMKNEWEKNEKWREKSTNLKKKEISEKKRSWIII